MPTIPLPRLKYNRGAAFPPDVKDLDRLFKNIVHVQPLTVFEFGCGFSTFAIIEALKVVESRAKKIEGIEHPFVCFSIDTNKDWQDEIRSKIPEADRKRVIFHHSDCVMDTWNGQISCHYKTLPDVIPDFIYLDGPDPRDVKGDVNGVSFRHIDRPTINSDALMLESALNYQAAVLIDGRILNAHFLINNFKRQWNVTIDKENDFTFLQLSNGETKTYKSTDS